MSKGFERFVDVLVSDPASGVTWEGEFEGASYALRYDRGYIRGRWGEEYVCLPFATHWNIPGSPTNVWGVSWADWVRCEYGEYTHELAEKIKAGARERALKKVS